MDQRSRQQHALDQIQSVYADANGPYFNADDPRHKRAVEEMTRLFQLAYAEQADEDGRPERKTIQLAAEQKGEGILAIPARRIETMPSRKYQPVASNASAVALGGEAIPVPNDADTTPDQVSHLARPL